MQLQNKKNNQQIENKQFKNYRNVAQQLFGNKNNEGQSEITKQNNNKFKRTNFKNQIRRNQIQDTRKSMREILIKTLESKEFISLMEDLFEKQQFNSKSLTNLLTDLRRNMLDREFCYQIQNNSKIKQYILKVYQNNIDKLKISQKIILIQCLIFLTYYGTDCLSFDQIIQVNNLLKIEIQNMIQWHHQNLNYCLKITQLLTNFTASYSIQQNYQLMDSKILMMINNKINIFQKLLQNSNQNIQQLEKYGSEINSIKNSILQLITNLSNPKYQNQNFFMYVINDLINQKGYLKNLQIATKVFKVLNNFFINNKFRSILLNNCDFCAWYTQNMVQIAQQKYNNQSQIKTGQFKNYQLSIQQLDIFSGFLSNLLTWIQQDEEQTFDQQTKTFIQQNLNGYLLSQFLIQSASQQKRNSQYVFQAFRILQYLAYDTYVTKQQLLIVRKGRQQEQILKVFLNSTYFNSIKTSQTVLSFLNKLLSKDSKILQILMQLRIFQCINDFFTLQIPQNNGQIIKMFDLLMIMIASEDDLIKEKNNQNRIIRLLQKDGLLKIIQKYQDQQSKAVTDKVQMFLKYIQAKSGSSVILDNQLQI